MPRGKAMVCGVLLLALVGLKVLNSIWVLGAVALATSKEELRKEELGAAFTSTAGERIQRALRLPLEGEHPDANYRRFRLLEKHVEENARVYYVHEFRGPTTTARTHTFFCLLALLYPRDLQLSKTIPLPKNAHLEGKPVYALDLRGTKPPTPPQGYEKMTEQDGEVLWRLEHEPR